MFASAGTVLKLHAWSNNHLEPVAVYKPKKTYSLLPKITHISWCHDNSYISILQEGSHPQILSTKDKSTVSLIHTVQALKCVTAISFKNHTKRIISLGNKNGEVILYDTKNRSLLKKVGILSSPVKSLEFNFKDDQLAIGCSEAVSIFIDHDGINNFVKEIDLPGTYSVIKFHPSIQHFVATGGKNGQVTLIDTEKNETVYNLHKHSSLVTGLLFAEGQKAVVTAGLDHKICLYDYTSLKYLFRMNIQQAVRSLDISSDEKYLAAGLEDGCIHIYDIRQPLKPLECTNSHDGPINKISFEKGPNIIDNLFERNSVTTLNESEFSDTHNLEVNCMGDIDKSEKVDDKLKKDLLKIVKTHMTYLETQLADHCAKFQGFISNEFDCIHNAMARWDVFNVGDTTEIAQFIDTNEAKSIKSSYTCKSNH